MTVVAQKLSGIGPTADGKRCEIRFEKFGGAADSLQFPSDQLQSLIGLGLQVERQALAKGELSMRSKVALLVSGVEIALDTQNQNILMDFQVDKMHFAFSIPREHAVQIVEIMKSKLPSH